VKFCDKDHGLVRLDARREGAFLRVSVQDNGIGIAEQDQDKIFERFQQAGDTLTDKPQGTGLGLPICRQILKRFGGDIWVKSERGKGATFSFRLPLAASSEHDGAFALERVG
jgi:signal transduction histidine kinase